MLNIFSMIYYLFIELRTSLNYFIVRPKAESYTTILQLLRQSQAPLPLRVLEGLRLANPKPMPSLDQTDFQLLLPQRHPLLVTLPSITRIASKRAKLDDLRKVYSWTLNFNQNFYESVTAPYSHAPTNPFMTSVNMHKLHENKLTLNI